MQSRTYQRDELVMEHSERQAEVWLVKVLKAAGLKDGERAEVKGSDERKVLLVCGLLIGYTLLRL